MRSSCARSLNSGRRAARLWCGARGSFKSVRHGMHRPRLKPPRCKPSGLAGSNLRPTPEYIKASAMERTFTCDFVLPVYNDRAGSLSLRDRLETVIRLLSRLGVQRSGMGSKLVLSRTSVRPPSATTGPEDGILGEPFLGTHGVSVRSLLPSLTILTEISLLVQTSLLKPTTSGRGSTARSGGSTASAV